MFHILVADDDRNTRRYMQAVLEDAHYTVTTAKDGAEALDILGRKHIDLIVLDVMMPEMDGYELTRELREAQDNIPILMVSARQEGREEKEREMCQGLKEMIDEARQEGREEKEKEIRQGLQKMVDEARQEGRDEAARITRVENARLFIEKTGWTLEQVADILGLTDSDCVEIRQMDGQAG